MKKEEENGPEIPPVRPVCPSACAPVRPSARLSARLSACPPVCPPDRLSSRPPVNSKRVKWKKSGLISNAAAPFVLSFLGTVTCMGSALRRQ